MSPAPDTDPVLPNELFLMISEDLEPGTWTLANLAATCSSLYRLLLPRLYHSIDGKRLFGKFDATVDNVDKKDSRVPSGLCKVIELDVFLDREWALMHQTSVVRSCTELRHLICSSSLIFYFYFDFSDVSKTLETLEVYGDPGTGDEEWLNMDVLLYDNPKFQALRLKGTPNFAAGNFTASMSMSCF